MLPQSRGQGECAPRVWMHIRMSSIPYSQKYVLRMWKFPPDRHKAEPKGAEPRGGGCQAITVFIFYEKQQVCSASPAWTNKGWVYHRRQYKIFGCLICDFNLRGQGENDTDYCFNCMCRSQDFSFWEGSELLTAATLGWLKQMLCVKTRSTGTHKHSPQQNSS